MSEFTRDELKKMIEAEREARAKRLAPDRFMYCPSCRNSRMSQIFCGCDCPKRCNICGTDLEEFDQI